MNTLDFSRIEEMDPSTGACVCVWVWVWVWVWVCACYACNGCSIVGSTCPDV